MVRMRVRHIVLAVLGKISNLLIQESDSLLGFEDQIQSIETFLREWADYAENIPNRKRLREIMYDLEDLIDELIVKSDKRRNRDALVRYISGFLYLPNHFFFVLAVIDLVNHYRLRLRFEQIKIDVHSVYNFIFQSGFWWDSFNLYQLDIGYAIISPVISLFETLATQNQLSLAVRRQARWLRDEFKSLFDFVKNVESKELSEEGMLWMEEVFDVCRSAENVVGFFMDLQQKQMKNGKLGCFDNLVWAPRNFISQHKLARKMAWIKDKIFDIYERSFRAIPSHPMPRRDNLRISFQQNEVLPYGFEEDIDAVTAQLLKDDPRCITISIVGVRGIGKKSLVKLIYDSQLIADHFPHRIWVPGETNIEIMAEILGVKDIELYCPYYDTEESFRGRVRQMVNAFFMNKKYLIVIDYSRTASEYHNAGEFWRGMGSAFNNISNGTRILFIVCNLREAPPVTETDFTYRLHLRSHDESWALFTHALKVSIPQDMQNLKGHIIRKCGGLPKVILKLGELLSQRDATVEELSRVLDQLNQDEQHWSEVLEEINKYLPLYLRRCLFYFGLFPLGYKIPARRLIALWVAEGLGRQHSDEKSPECVAEACLKELINCNMVQVIQKKFDGKVKNCCLPEALRVHWFSKAKQVNFLQGHFNLTDTSIGVIRRLADHLDQNEAIFDHIHGNNNASLYSHYRDVVSFLSFDTREGSRPGEDIGNFLDRCISSNCFLFLWVLDLENVYKPKLPKAVAQLISLRYLGLRSTYLEMLPIFINKLLNLQTLDLKRTCINTLPSSIWKMQKLRHLFLDESFRSTFDGQQEDSSLVDLKTLWGAFVDEGSPVRNGLDTSLNITKLGLKCKISVPSQKAAMSSQLIDVANWVLNIKHLQSLRLKSFDESGQPWDLHLESLISHMDLSNIYLLGKLKNQHLVSELPSSLVELTLSASGLVEDPMQALDKLPNLRTVRLLSRSFTGKKMLCSFGGFPKLEILKFWELELLEEWNVQEGAMPSLKDLEIRSCRNLKMLPDGLQHIRTLRELKVTKSPLLSSRILDNQGEDWNKIAHVRYVCNQV